MYKRQTLSRFEIPNVANLRTEDVVALRKYSDTFSVFRSDLRDALQRAHLRSDRLGELTTTERFETIFQRELTEQRNTQLSKEIESSNVLRDLLIPGGVGVGIGFLNVHIDPRILTDPDKLLLTLAEMSGPGVAWMAAALSKRIQRRKNENSYSQVYATLLA